MFEINTLAAEDDGRRGDVGRGVAGAVGKIEAEVVDGKLKAKKKSNNKLIANQELLQMSFVS